MSLFTRDFRQGSKPATGTTSARDHMQSAARDRVQAGAPQGSIITSFSYGAGWGGTFFSVGDPILGSVFASVSDWEAVLPVVPLFVGGQVVPSQNPLVSLGLETVTECANRLIPPDYVWEKPTGYYFKSGASATLQYVDFIEPGTYQIKIATNGGNTSGSVKVFCGTKLVATLNGVGAQTINTTFISSAYFSVKFVQTNMTVDYSWLAWETNFGPGTVLQTGTGLPPSGLTGFPDWDQCVTPSPPTVTTLNFTNSNVPNDPPSPPIFGVSYGVQMTGTKIA